MDTLTPDQRFANALAFTLRWEGGQVDDPADPGGRTNKGITQTTYDAWQDSHGLPRGDVFQITDDTVHQIYQTQYWDGIQGNDHGFPLDMVLFDSAVNHGVHRAQEWLHQAWAEIPDGTPSEQLAGTLAAAVVDLRYRFYLRLGHGSLRKFLKGWLNRLHSLKVAIGLIPS